MTARPRTFGAGRIVYHLWHRPNAWFRTMAREGGPVEQCKTEAGRLAMIAAAAQLPSLASLSDEPLDLHLLTGERFWHQTIFCLWTFAKQSHRRLRPLLYDDGTLDDAHCEPFRRLFPETRFFRQDEILKRLEAPFQNLPTLARLRRDYPNIRKLIDVHLHAEGEWKLVLDSDLLFFRNPSLLAQWLEHPAQPLHAVDIMTSYGYSRGLLDGLAGSPLQERVNVGITGLNSASLDWEKIEAWCRILIEKEGFHYYLEQAVIAMLVAGKSCAVAPEKEYVTFPKLPEARDCAAIMHHYVAESKRWYYQENWRRALGNTTHS